MGSAHKQFWRLPGSARKLIDLGVPQGPAIGRLLDELREAKLDGLVLDEEDEIRWLQERIE